MKRRMYCVVNDVVRETLHMFMYRTFNIAAMIAAVRTNNLISLISSNEVNHRSGLLLFITIFFLDIENKSLCGHTHDAKV